MSYPFENIKAILFDMDGTLWDTERVTERAIGELLTEWNIDRSGIDLLTFHGIKWSRIGALLEERFARLRGRNPATAIEARFQQINRAQAAPLIPGAVEAVRAAAAALPDTTAIVTGSDATEVEHFLDLTELRNFVTLYTSCNMYERSKPDPESFLMTAQRLQVAPEHCLVFEDSKAGMRAARAGGMHCIGISGADLRREAIARELTDRVITNFTELPEDFFATATQDAGTTQAS